METTKAAFEAVKSNILISAIIIVLALIICFLLYKNAPPMINKKAEAMTNEERELDDLIDELNQRQNSI